MHKIWMYPLNLPAIAEQLKKKQIDIAPHRIEWCLCARDIANAMGEDGREVFHTIASVWPGYDRHDSEICFNQALRNREPNDFTPYIYWACRKRKFNLNKTQFRKGKPILREIITITKKQKIKKMIIGLDYFLSTQLKKNELTGLNHLTDLLLRLYPRDKVLEVVEKYAVGFGALISRQVLQPLIFWQIDENYNLVNAKRMQYKLDGHRDKNIAPRILYPDNPTCLFGLHLANQAETISIVESEKTCLIMSLEMPCYTWMACGGLNLLNEALLKPIKGKSIIFWPDLDNETDPKTGLSRTYISWSNIANRLNRFGYKIEMNNLLELKATTMQRYFKWDIADLFINERINKAIGIKDENDN